MRLQIMIGLVAEGVKYREFTRVVDLPVIPNRIDVGIRVLVVDDIIEPLTYYVAEEMYRLHWEVEITDKGMWDSVADRHSGHADCFRDVGFVEELDDDTEGVEGET